MSKLKTLAAGVIALIAAVFMSSSAMAENFDEGLIPEEAPAAEEAEGGSSGGAGECSHMQHVTFVYYNEKVHQQKCVDCGKILKDEEHYEMPKMGTPSTCTKPGQESYIWCGVCGGILSGGQETPALGHNYGDLIEEKAATATEAGMKAHYECSRCFALFDENKKEADAKSLTIPYKEEKKEGSAAGGEEGGKQAEPVTPATGTPEIIDNGTLTASIQADKTYICFKYTDKAGQPHELDTTTMNKYILDNTKGTIKFDFKLEDANEHPHDWTQDAVNPATITIKVKKLDGTTQEFAAKAEPDSGLQATLTWGYLQVVDEFPVIKTGDDVVVWMEERRPNVDSVSVTPPTVELKPGETKQLRCDVSPAEADNTLVYASSDETVAKVSAEGLIIAVAPGDATIIVTATNGTYDPLDDKMNVCYVTVTGGAGPVQPSGSPSLAYDENVSVPTPTAAKKVRSIYTAWLGDSTLTIGMAEFTLSKPVVRGRNAGRVKVSASVTSAATGRRFSCSGYGTVAADGTITAVLSKGKDVIATVTFQGESVVGEIAVDGVFRPVNGGMFAERRSDKAKLAAVKAFFKGTWTAAVFQAGDDLGAALSVRIGASGRAQVKLIDGNGRSISVASRIAVGKEGYAAVPVVKDGISFVLWLGFDGSAQITGLPSVGAAGARLTLSKKNFAAVAAKCRVYDDDGKAVAATGLKLRYMPTTGLVTGSFKVGRVSYVVNGIVIGDNIVAVGSSRKRPVLNLTNMTF